MAITTDFVVIGSGIAGLRAVVELAQAGQVMVLTKGPAKESNTEYAQGGVAVALSDDDEVTFHYDDTIYAGDGLCEEPAVRMLVSEGPRRIEELIEWGVEFDKEGSKLAFTQEAAHSRRRILHAQGDSTGREINRALIAKVSGLRNAQLKTHARASRLLVEKGQCYGVRYLDLETGRPEEVHCQAVLLATGGCGVLYRETTNPDVATGDGHALALQAGVVMADMEFVQFHPTALKKKGSPTFLLSEALRGEGARLLNASGRPFMQDYHQMADLAPRDVVSRSIFIEAQKQGTDHVLLDLTHLGEERIRERFPRIYSTCLEFGLNLGLQPAPVFPAAHYMMGGVLTDLEGATTLQGLFAAGEVTSTGVHGANRLASNSLLEGLVFGARAARGMIAGLPARLLPVTDKVWTGKFDRAEENLMLEELRSLMTDQVGIVRTAESLQRALESLQNPLPAGELKKTLASLLLCGWATAQTALIRKESRGGHFRSDFPDRNDQDWKNHLLVQLNAEAREWQIGRADRF